jgi:prolyl oligopeptidase
MRPQIVLAVACAVLSSVPARVESEEDPYLWLESVTGKKALGWVKKRNAVTRKELEAQPEFKALQERILDTLNSDARIPQVQKLGSFYYNFWRDEEHERGLWRRTTLDEYRKSEPAWEPVLDIDALAKQDGENWVWAGAECVYPTYDRCLVSLSRGGADATVVREFDVVSKSFVRGGFELAEAKSEAHWRHRDALYVGTDFGPGSMTSSGYPRIVKEWGRGRPLGEAALIYEGQPEDVWIAGYVHDHNGIRRELIYRGMTFYTSELFVRDREKLLRLDKPADAQAQFFDRYLLLELRSDWTVGGRTWPQGSLLAIDFDRFMAGSREFTSLFEPGPRRSLAGVALTKGFVIVNELENVRGRLHEWKVDGGRWTHRPIDAPRYGSLYASGVDRNESDDYFLTVTDFVTPTTLYLGRAGGDGREKLKNLPEFFDASSLEISQQEAGSRDRTRVPYFQVSPKDLKLDGRNPTLLYGYGGFEASLTPYYNPVVGQAWLARGGVYVVANIRGGGEFGPQWHQAALKHNRQRAYDDFIAIAEDLIARKVTSPPHLGIMGGSNGGLLVGVMLTQRPDLFGAVVCQVPLLDMRRYHKLLAGASWMEEYGNPDDPREWEFLAKYSPYHNLREDAKYPRTLFVTSTRDDRVHPGHARKMFARMSALGHDVLYYENVEGGHGAAANNRQQAYLSALAYTFLRQQLGVKS